MIGVVADPKEYEVVREFFELFKTPWEFYRAGRPYDVLLNSGVGVPDATVKLVIAYCGADVGPEPAILSRCSHPTCTLLYDRIRIPIYKGAITFPEKLSGLLLEEKSRTCAAYLDRSPQGTVAWLGYDLFAEVRHLLESGQPPVNADLPTLDLHISFLRDLITACGVPLVEVPPVPAGYEFISCLTHDVDHPSIRAHGFDHTTFGFLYRAVFGSLPDLMRGRKGIRQVLKNWFGALKLPFVYLGLAEDFWSGFDKRYLELEEGLRATYFVIPFRGHPGKKTSGTAPRHRAASYAAQDIATTIQKLMRAGCEVGLHGIDAWRDSANGREELEEVRRITRQANIGVRMHWLYYDPQAPLVLEEGGAAYDATAGYNETVGYRAGTSQVYKPPGTLRLRELPLHVMDTALFYPAYLGLSPRKASELLTRMLDNAAQCGGCLTINWHDRSLAPERLWTECYDGLLQGLKIRNAWFATAGQAVSWFERRRSVVFHADGDDVIRAEVMADSDGRLPALLLRIHNSCESNEMARPRSKGYVDIPFRERASASCSNVVAG